MVVSYIVSRMTPTVVSVCRNGSEWVINITELLSVCTVNGMVLCMRCEWDSSL